MDYARTLESLVLQIGAHIRSVSRMAESEAFEQFTEGLTLLRAGEPRAALPHLRKAVALDAYDPFYWSYLGLALGMAQEEWAEAEDICLQALRMKRPKAELYLNLAEVYCHAGKRDDAVWILNRGLGLTMRDPRLQDALMRLGVRRPPVLAFLKRKNFLNRSLGRLRQRLQAGRTQTMEMA